MIDDYKEKSESGFKYHDRYKVKFLYGETGSYIGYWADYEFVDHKNFITKSGEEPPREFKEFKKFLSSLRYAHDLVADDGTVYDRKDTWVFPDNNE